MTHPTELGWTKWLGGELGLVARWKVRRHVARCEGCRDRLADFKVPKKIHIADALPRTATGKIQRRHVAAHFLKQSRCAPNHRRGSTILDK